MITTDPSDLIFDYAERIAICCEAGDVTAEEAERIATAQCGASLDELIALQVNYWRQRKMCSVQHQGLLSVTTGVNNLFLPRAFDIRPRDFDIF